MSEYVVMFPADDEQAWEAGSEADHQATYDTDAAFVAQLRAAGGSVTGGAELAHSRGAWTLRTGEDGAVLEPGPSTGSVGQLTGFLMVTCEDEQALLAAARVLTAAHPVVEVRPVAPS